MKIIQLFLKEQHGAVVSRTVLSLQRGQGIAGDVNACVGSPRQILFVSQPFLLEFGLAPGDLSENILVDAEIERLSSGQVLQIGNDALVRLTCFCDPCSNLEKLQPGLTKRLLGKRGFLAMVVRAGMIYRGDAISLTNYQFPAIPNHAKGKFYEFLPRIPVGRVVRTPELLMALGLTKSYYRSVPTFLRKAQGKLPVHRIVGRDGSLMNKYVDCQHQTLLEEGVEVVANRVPSKYCWEPTRFHDLELLTESLSVEKCDVHALS